MPVVNFYLKKPEIYYCPKHPNKIKWGAGECPTCGARMEIRKREKGLPDPSGSPDCLIVLQMKYRGQRLVYGTGEHTPLSAWNDKKQRVKSSRQLTRDRTHGLNDLLDNLKKELERGYDAEIKNGTPTPDTLRKYLTDFMNRNLPDSAQPERKDLFSFIKVYQEKSGGKKYGVLLNHLKAFNPKLTFDSIDIDFFESYTKWLGGKHKQLNHRTGKLETVGGLSHNSIGKDIKSLKAVMNLAVRRKLTPNEAHKDPDFSFAEKEVENVALSEAEIVRLFRFDFSGDKRLEAVRDLFIVGTQTGLRISDFTNLKPENIIYHNGVKFIKVITQKTGDTVAIPVNEILEEIFERYKSNPNSLPRAISDQKFNKYLKEACQAAGFIQTGRLLTAPEKPLWEAISSHTARRSFATNLYLSGFPALEIRKITGHKSEGSFLKYLKIESLQYGERLAAHQEKTRSQRQLN